MVAFFSFLCVLNRRIALKTDAGKGAIDPSPSDVTLQSIVSNIDFFDFLCKTDIKVLVGRLFTIHVVKPQQL